MKVLIAGAGRLGGQIAQVLHAASHTLTLVDPDRTRLAALADRLDTARMVAGDASEPAVLEEAAALTADLLIAATGRDQDNLVISLLAKRQFAVPRVVARINDSDNTWLFDERWGVDVAVPAATPLISLIEEATGATDTVALLRLSKAGVNVLETVISASSPAAGRRLGEISLPTGTVVAAIIRRGQPTVPDPDFRLQADDEILVVSDQATHEAVHAAFQ